MKMYIKSIAALALILISANQSFGQTVRDLVCKNNKQCEFMRDLECQNGAQSDYCSEFSDLEKKRQEDLKQALERAKERMDREKEAEAAVRNSPYLNGNSADLYFTKDLEISAKCENIRKFSNDVIIGKYRGDTVSKYMRFSLSSSLADVKNLLIFVVNDIYSSNLGALDESLVNDYGAKIELKCYNEIM